MNLNSVDTLSNWLFPVEHKVFPGKIWFDWDGFVNLLLKHNVTYTRCFAWVVPWLNNVEQRAAVMPYARVGSRYDLNSVFVPWATMADRVNALCGNGITPILSLDDHCSRTGARNWRNHPHKRENNIQNWGPSDHRQAAWTGPDHAHEEQWMVPTKQIWHTYQTHILSAESRNKVIWELTNEPVNPDWPWRTLRFLQAQGVPRARIWASVTPHNRKKCFFEPGYPDHVWGKPERDEMKKGVSTISIHQCGAWEEVQTTIYGKKVNGPYSWANKYCEGDYAAYCAKHGLKLRADNDGSNNPDGSPLWQTPVNNVMIPHGGVAGVEKIAAKLPFAFLLLSGDGPQTAAEWKATWKTAAPYFRVLGNA